MACRIAAISGDGARAADAGVEVARDAARSRAISSGAARETVAVRLRPWTWGGEPPNSSSVIGASVGGESSTATLVVVSTTMPWRSAAAAGSGAVMNGAGGSARLAPSAPKASRRAGLRTRAARISRRMSLMDVLLVGASGEEGGVVPSSMARRELSASASGDSSPELERRVSVEAEAGIGARVGWL